jgi:hypothetical protein
MYARHDFDWFQLSKLNVNVKVYLHAYRLLDGSRLYIIANIYINDIDRKINQCFIAVGILT